MKKVIAIILLAIAAYGAWHFFVDPPDTPIPLDQEKKTKSAGTNRTPKQLEPLFPKPYILLYDTEAG